MSDTVRLAWPEFDDTDLARLREVLDSGWLVQGKFVAQFEAQLTAQLGQAAIACSSGTAALHLALMALGIGPGDEVLVPAFTWPATAATVVLVGATPVFVDVDLDWLAIDPAAAAQAITPRTRAMVPVHLFGIPAPVRPLMALAETHDLKVVEDAACALGTATPLGEAGTIGQLGCYSFHPRKNVTTGEGGVVTTADPALAERVRSLLNHGIERDDTGIVFTDAGLNYRLSDLAGAIGVGQLERFDEILAARRRLGHAYLRRLAALPMRLPAGLSDAGNTFQSLVIELPSEDDRDALLAHLRDRAIQCTIGTYAVTSQPFYVERYGTSAEAFPNADRLMRRLVTLPLHHRMRDDELDRVVDAVDAWCAARFT